MLLLLLFVQKHEFNHCSCINDNDNTDRWLVCLNNNQKVYHYNSDCRSISLRNAYRIQSVQHHQDEDDDQQEQWLSSPSKVLPNEVALSEFTRPFPNNVVASVAGSTVRSRIFDRQQPGQKIFVSQTGGTYLLPQWYKSPQNLISQVLSRRQPRNVPIHW